MKTNKISIFFFIWDYTRNSLVVGCTIRQGLPLCVERHRLILHIDSTMKCEMWNPGRMCETVFLNKENAPEQ